MIDPIYAKIESQPRPTLSAALGLILIAAAGLWLSALTETLWPGMGPLTVNALYYLPFVLLPVALYLWRRPGCAEALRLSPPPTLPILGVALLALLSAYAASGLTSLWDFALDALRLRQPGSAALPQTKRALSMSILAMAALPAVCEELLFRGLVFSAWESRGTAFAIGVTATLFALLHGNLYGLPAYLLVGAVSGCVTFALDSVYAGMIYHTLYNAAVLILSYLLAGKAAGEAAEAAEAAASASTLFPVALMTLTTLALMAVLLAALVLQARERGIMAIPRIRRPLSPRERALLAGTVGVMLASMVVIQALPFIQGGI